MPPVRGFDEQAVELRVADGAAHARTNGYSIDFPLAMASCHILGCRAARVELVGEQIRQRLGCHAIRPGRPHLDSRERGGKARSQCYTLESLYVFSSTAPGKARAAANKAIASWRECTPIFAAARASRTRTVA